MATARHERGGIWQMLRILVTLPFANKLILQHQSIFLKSGSALTCLDTIYNMV